MTLHVTIRGVLEVIGGATVVICTVWLLYALWMLCRWGR